MTHSSVCQRGFTLVELMAGLAIAGILASVALPTFESQLQRSRRSDALNAAMAVQTAQERFRSNAPTYGNLLDIGVGADSTAKHYKLQMTANDADGFELVAVAVGVQHRDLHCRHMKLTAVKMTLVHTSGPDADFTNAPAANRKCWSL